MKRTFDFLKIGFFDVPKTPFSDKTIEILILLAKVKQHKTQSYFPNRHKWHRFLTTFDQTAFLILDEPHDHFCNQKSSANGGFNMFSCFFEDRLICHYDFYAKLAKSGPKVSFAVCGFYKGGFCTPLFKKSRKVASLVPRHLRWVAKVI